MGPDFVKWPHAIESAIVSIYKYKVLDLIDHPKGVKCIERTRRYKRHRHRCSHLQDIRLVGKKFYNKVQRIDSDKI
jgi:hypothetical protein